MKNFDLDYFYGSEAEQFSFYRLPKILFTGHLGRSKNTVRTSIGSYEFVNKKQMG